MNRNILEQPLHLPLQVACQHFDFVLVEFLDHDFLLDLIDFVGGLRELHRVL